MNKLRGTRSHAFPRQAILLAAGLGTRLRPLTYRIPKPALPVGGIPIILFNLYLLKKAGIKKVVINLHHQPAPLQKLLKDAGRHLGLKIEWSLEKNILGTAGGIAKALRKLKPELTFILNGDILLDLNLKKMMVQHRHRGAAATLAVVPPDRASVKNFVEFAADKRIYRIGGIPTGKVRAHLSKGIFAGAHLVDPQLFRSVPRRQFTCVIQDVYQQALAQGVLLLSYSHGGHWWDLGDLKSLKEVDHSLWNGTAPKAILQLWQEVRTWSQSIL
jgi:mannose-1-phosphate guanylyltransferase